MKWSTLETKLLLKLFDGNCEVFLNCYQVIINISQHYIYKFYL
jgi:hypothetical protein